MLIILYLFIATTIIQLCYYLCIFSKFAFHKTNNKSENHQKNPISVIICAKDEAKNLNEFLPEIYAQDYPDFEVVLVDDRSIDNTLEIMESFKKKHPDNTKIVKIEFSNNQRFIGNKKYALTFGIKAAKYNHLLFTDADCQPGSKKWIEKIASKFSQKKEIVLAYGKYQSVKKSFLNKIIRYETMQTALQYFSYALKENAYMGVGRNLAYTEELFMNNNGFYSHLDIMSGDDDLFINEASTTENTTICYHHDSFTISKPKQTWKELIHQKRRHISTAGHYKFKHQVLLGGYYLSNLLFFISLVFLLANKFQWKIVLGIVLVRYLIWIVINYKTSKKLDEKGLIYLLPFLEIGLILFQFFIFAVNLIKKPKNWTN